METPCPFGTSTTSGYADGAADIHTLAFSLGLEHPAADVWAAVATPGGLPRWLAAADFTPRAGSAVTLRRLPGGGEDERTEATGTVTAYEPQHAVSYSIKGDGDTVDDVIAHGRIRCELAPLADGTLLRLTHELRGDDDRRLDCLAGWHAHLELLVDALDGRTADRAAWRPDRFTALRGEYARRP